jgi:FlaG protein
MDGPRETYVMEHGPDSIGGRVIPLRPGTGAASRFFRSGPAPGSPPPEVQADLATAQQVIAELAARQVNLHFDVDHDTGQVRVEMLDGQGEVIKEIPARRVLDTLSGGGLLVDERA